MPSYQKWEEVEKSIVALQLDDRNPRLPGGRAQPSQRDLISELLEYEDVDGLAKDIAEVGWIPLESLVGIRSRGKIVIVEGNRRLAALKLLDNPELAPNEAAVRRFKKLSETMPDESRSVRVLIAPKRQAAAVLILRKHTRLQVRGWTPLMQARFYRSLAASGLSLQQMASEYGETPSGIAHFLRIDSMYRAACNIDLPEDVRDVVHDPRSFPASVLRRLIDVPKTREFLGIEFDENGDLAGRIQKDEFAKGLRRILADIARKAIDTRKLNKTEEIEQYLKGFGGDTPNTSKRGTFTADTVGSASSSSAGTDAPQPKPKAPAAGSRQAAPSKSVVPKGVKCTLSDPRIKEVFAELKSLKVDEYPNASAVMLRMVLELCLSNYLDKTGKIQPAITKSLPHKGAKWYPPLSQMLRLVADDVSIPIPTLQRKALSQMVDRQKLDQFACTVDDLDGFVHNRHMFPSPRDLRLFWNKFGDLFTLVLAEPPKPSASPNSSPH